MSADNKVLLESILRDALCHSGLELVREHRFHDKRRFLFDWAIPDIRLAIEYEGLFGGKKSRHTTTTGYCNDCLKYNLATELGWKVYRFHAKDFQRKPTKHYKRTVTDTIDFIRSILCQEISKGKK